MLRALTVCAAVTVPLIAHADPPQLRDCAGAADRQWCQEAHAMVRKYGPKPTDYVGMRNIAYCQWTGCGGGFVVDRAGSCALRRQIMVKFAGRTDGSDDMHFANCVKAGH
ncbi:hypothetical protein [Bosea sp. (in: a-proteobacteria)]|uniref:hypothetical protein n=1 Tax=Bosea sp. (in: a-proteobacteria) TaxID=1871050 RepID=UPI003B3B724E